MSKEIFTTANINEIVTPIYESMKAGNPVAKLVFDLNDAINALKPGRPISKAERDRIEFMWDNLLVGLANELVNKGEGIASVVGDAVDDGEIKVEDKYFDSVLYKWHKAYNDMNAKEEKKEEEGYSDAAKLTILDGLTNMIKTKGTKAIAEALEISEDIIIEVIRRSEGAEDKFFKELKPSKALICTSESSYVNDDDDEEDNDTADDAKELEHKLYDALSKILGDTNRNKCKIGCCIKPRPVMVKVSKLDGNINKMLEEIDKMFDDIM